jgi:purine-binding chemotaxis protein CheW
VGHDGVHLLLFEVAGQRHALLAADVREVVRAVALVPLPGSPACEGALDLRGQVVPVLDVRGRLGLPHRPLSLNDHLIIVAPGRRLAALRVDHACELRHISTGNLTRVDGEREQGEVARLPEGLLPVHEAARLLTILPAEGQA